MVMTAWKEHQTHQKTRNPSHTTNTSAALASFFCAFVTTGSSLQSQNEKGDAADVTDRKASRPADSRVPWSRRDASQCHSTVPQPSAAAR